MPLVHLEVSGLRILQQISLQPSARLNLIIGPNASGKTSVLEAIHLLACGRSFRTSNSTNVIRHGEHCLVVYAKHSNAAGQTTSLGLERERGSYRIQINGTRESRLSALAKVFALRSITPDTHYRFYHSSKQRRASIDWGLFHVEHGFHDDWLAYQRIVKQRNALLRTSKDRDALTVWDQRLIANANRIQDYRERYLADWNPLLSGFAETLLGTTDLVIALRPGWRQDIGLEQALLQDRERDLNAGYTHSGPHRADLSIRLDGQATRDTASQGQQKMVNIVLVLAQLQMLLQQGAQTPVLLLDDLAAELDSERRSALMGILSRLPIQIFATATAREQIEPGAWGDYKLFHVEHGCVEEARSLATG